MEKLFKYYFDSEFNLDFNKKKKLYDRNQNYIKIYCLVPELLLLLDISILLFLCEQINMNIVTVT